MLNTNESGPLQTKSLALWLAPPQGVWNGPVKDIKSYVVSASANIGHNMVQFAFEGKKPNKTNQQQTIRTDSAVVQLITIL